MGKKNKTKKLLRRAGLLFRLLSDSCTEKPLNAQKPFDLSGLHVCTLTLRTESELVERLVEMGIESGPVYWKEFAMVDPQGGGLMVLEDVSFSKYQHQNYDGCLKVEVTGTLKDY